MKSRILQSSYILNFLDIDFQADELSKILKIETDKAFEPIVNNILKDWEVHFVFTYNNVRGIFIYSKSQSYPIEKYKEIIIHIPIPNKQDVLWGVTNDQYINKIDHLDKIKRNFTELDVNFQQFENLKSYLLDCMRRSINFCLKEGFAVSGVKVKIAQSE